MNLRLLLDEHISPFLTGSFASIGVFAQGVAHIGLSGKSDPAVWAYALAHEMIVVTTNAADFLVLADAEMHPGLILLRESGLSREEQWRQLEPVVRFLQSQSDSDFLLNGIIEILGPNRFHLRHASES